MFVETKREGEVATPVDLTEAWRAILLSAADFLECHRWIQANFADGTGGYCVRGAIYSASGYDGSMSNNRSIYLMARAKFTKFLGIEDCHDWNDAPGRTKEEVITALRAAARS